MDREEPASTGQPESPGHDAYDYELSTQGRSVSDPCQDAIATLYGFLDGELNVGEAGEDPVPLEECSPCFAAFGFEAELKAVISRKCGMTCPILYADGS